MHFILMIGSQQATWGLGLLFLTFSTLASVAFATILRFNEARAGSRLTLLACNYLIAAGSSLSYWAVTGLNPIGTLTLGLGLVAGVMFVSTAWIMQAAMARVGIGITVAVTRLSVILPIIASIAVYAEFPTALQWAGLALAGGSLYFFGASAGALTEGAHQPLRNWVLLAGVFATMGCNNILLKLFSEHCPRADKPGFLTVIFSVAMVCAWSMVWSRREFIRGRDVGLGLLLGIPNFCSTIFFILALAAIPGIVAFPVNDIGVVVGSTLVGVAVWHERLDPLRRWALLLALASIVLINLR